jgi:hypothetical protein
MMGDPEVEAHGEGLQANEIVVEDDDDEVEAHGGGLQANETVVEGEG